MSDNRRPDSAGSQTVGAGGSGTSENHVEAALGATVFDEPALRTMIEAAPYCVYWVDPEGQIRLANKRAVDIFGQVPDDKAARIWFGRAVETDRARIKGIWARIFGRDEEVETEFRMIDQKGRMRWMHAHASPYLLSDGAYGGHLVALQDITLTKENTLRLTEQARLLERAEQVAQIGHWRLLPLTSDLYWSPGVYRIHGFDEEAFVPTLEAAVGFYHPDDRALVDQFVREAGRTGKPFQFRLRLIRADGAERWVEAYGEVQKTAEGLVEEIFGTFRDVTEQMEATKELERRQEHFRLATDGALVGIWDYDIPRGTCFVSDSYFAQLGFEPGEVEVTYAWYLSRLHPDDKDRVVHELLESIGEGKIFSTRYRMRRKTGEYIWIQVRGAIRKNDNGEPVRMSGSTIDVTKECEAEAQLRDAYARQTIMLKASGTLLFVLDMPDGDAPPNTPMPPSLVTGNVEEILGFPPEDFIGGSVVFMERIHPDDAAGLERAYRNLRSVGRAQGEYRFQRADGKYRWVRETMQAVPGSSGKRQVVGCLIDIHERKLQELAAAEAMAEARAANRAKSEFLAMMSHEIRTPMNGILGLAGMLLDGDLSPDQRQLVGTLQESADGLLSILNDILDISKLEAGRLSLHLGAVDLHREVQAAADLIAAVARDKGIGFETQGLETLPRAIRSDGLRLRQILLNLLSNAVKFTEAGQVRLSLQRLEAPDRSPLLQAVIEDSGIGIAPQDVPKLFTRFAQADASITRRFGGTGLGLAICKQLCDLMGGTIEVTSELEVGSTFTVSLPLTVLPESELDTLDPPQTEEADYRRGLHILVAEDHQVNQRVIGAILAKLGHSCRIVENGLEAVRALQAGEETFDLVLMDIQMPVLDGMSAAKLIRTLSDRDAKLPIIALTANAMSGDRERFLSSGLSGYVAKPIDLAALVSEINRVMTGHGSRTASSAESAPAHAPGRSDDGEPTPEQADALDALASSL